MTKWTHLSYLSIIAILTYLLWQQPLTVAQRVQQPQSTSSSLASDTQDAKSPNTAPQIEAAIAVETVENSASEISEAVEIEAAEGSAANQQPIRTESRSLTYSDAEVAELLKKTINVDKVKELLHTEAIDQDWAYAMQENLRLLYDNNEALHRATLNHIECYTTVCEVEFTNTEAPLDFMQSFHLNMVKEQWYSGNYQSVMMTNSETKTQTFYIVRSD